MASFNVNIQFLDSPTGKCLPPSHIISSMTCKSHAESFTDEAVEVFASVMKAGQHAHLHLRDTEEVIFTDVIEPLVPYRSSFDRTDRGQPCSHPRPWSVHDPCPSSHSGYRTHMGCER